MTGEQWHAAGLMTGYAIGLGLFAGLVLVLTSWWWRR